MLAQMYSALSMSVLRLVHVPITSAYGCSFGASTLPIPPKTGVSGGQTQVCGSLHVLRALPCCFLFPQPQPVFLHSSILCHPFSLLGVIDPKP